MYSHKTKQRRNLMISLSQFLEYKQKIEKLINKRPFCSRLLFEALIDDNFANEILPFINFFDKNLYDSKKIEDQFLKLHNKTIYYYQKANTKRKNKIQNYLKSLAYFYFLESIDEHSSFSDGLIVELKNKYGDKYLEIISNIDKSFLSKDMQTMENIQPSEKHIDCELLKCYQVLKRWQDIQHYYYEGGYGKEINNFQTIYCNKVGMSPFDIDFLTLRKVLFKKIKKNKIIDLDTVSLLCGLYIKKYVIKLIGGKMYGLGVLNLYGIKVPFSVVIPTGVKIKSNDLLCIKNRCERFSVRSSADIEDGEANSYAGMFDSYLDVTYDELESNIEKVKNSLNNDRLKSYIKEIGGSKPHMSVIIQEFIEPQYSGVWIGNNIDGGVLEWVKGNGEKLVSGKAIPHTEIWNKLTYTGENSIKSKDVAVAKILIKYQKELNLIADFEWMILNDELVMLQFRPVTKKITSCDVKNMSSDIKGIPASPGNYSGYAYYVDDFNAPIEKDKILLAYTTDPNWIPHLLKARAVVTSTGGFLCHAAIVCRELNIPCVTGIGSELLEILKDNLKKRLTVDGSCGNIIIEKEDLYV